MNLDDVAEDLVERSRLGEQNATAHISLVGEQYRSGIGGDSVKRSYEAIWTYLQNGPRKGRRRRKQQPPLSPDGRTVLRAMSGFGAEATDYTKRCGYLCALPIVSAGTGGMCCAIVLLACGPTIGRGQIEAAESALATPEALKSFNAGLNGKLAPDADPYAYAGHAFRKATAIQRIRRDPKPAHFDMLAKGLGWELGGA